MHICKSPSKSLQEVWVSQWVSAAGSRSKYSQGVSGWGDDVHNEQFLLPDLPQLPVYDIQKLSKSCSDISVQVKLVGTITITKDSSFSRSSSSMLNSDTTGPFRGKYFKMQVFL